jgi:hypothetical protein
VPVPEGSKPEGFEGGGADIIGAAIDAEQEPVGLLGGDEIATAVRTGVTVTVMALDVFADLLAIVKNLPIGSEKEIICNHGNFTVVRAGTSINLSALRNLLRIHGAQASTIA